MAPEAGRRAELVTVDGWLIADFAATTRLASATVCSDEAASATTLVFERISGDEQHPLTVHPADREIIDFEWNPESGELTYRTTTATRIFSDLEQVASASGANYPRCDTR
jgi:hypothetical protein